MEVIEVGEIGLSSRDLLLADGGICSVATCRGEADRGKAGTETEAEVGGGAVVLEAGRGDAMAAGTASGAIKERRRSAMRCAGIDGVCMRVMLSSGINSDWNQSEDSASSMRASKRRDWKATTPRAFSEGADVNCDETDGMGK